MLCVRRLNRAVSEVASDADVPVIQRLSCTRHPDYFVEVAIRCVSLLGQNKQGVMAGGSLARVLLLAHCAQDLDLHRLAADVSLYGCEVTS